MSAYVKCKKCSGSGTAPSHLNRYDGHKVGAGMGMHRCNSCAERATYTFITRRPTIPLLPGKNETCHLVFGLFGALFAGVLQPWGMGWFFGAGFGVIAAGMAAGFVSESRIGRVILGIIGFALVALMVAGIVMSGGD